MVRMQIDGYKYFPLPLSSFPIHYYVMHESEMNVREVSYRNYDSHYLLWCLYSVLASLLVFMKS